MTVFRGFLMCKPFLCTLFALFFSFKMLAQLPVCPPGQQGFADCEDINCIFCNLNGFVGSTAGFGADPDGDLSLFFCSSVQNVQYLAFISSVTNLSITVTLSNCTVNSGIDLGMMPNCDQTLNACVLGNGTNTTTIVASGLTIGQKYVLIVDVDATGPCDFTISTNPSTGTIPPSYIIPTGQMIVGDFAVCPNATTTYTLTPAPPVADYIWTAPPGTLINGQASPVTVTGTSTVTVTWGPTGGQLCVTPFNSCFTGTQICHNVTVTPIPTTVIPPITICAEEAPFVLPWSQDVYASGTYSATLPSFQGCDSLVKQTVIVRPQVIHYLSPIPLCHGNCATICGEQFCHPGTFTGQCKDVNGCDSLVKMTLVDITPVADIIGGAPFTCINFTDTLSSKNSIGVKTWLNTAGANIGTGNSVVINKPGTYFLSVAQTQFGATCVSLDTVVVKLDTLPPPMSATGGSVDCDTLPVFVHAITTVSPAGFNWTGPNGFTSTLQNPQVHDPGAYIVTGTNKTNGCKSQATALVTVCCHNFAGTMDSVSLNICGQKTIFPIHHGDQNLGAGDSLIFILYTNPADPFGSVVEYSDMPVFPFATGIVHPNIQYLVMGVAGHVLPGHSIDFSDPCLSLAPGPIVQWLPKPSISVVPAPNVVCKGDCMDVTFNFEGTPPFDFMYEVSQNGQVIHTGSATSDTPQKTITLCPSNFNPPAAGGNMNFKVSFYRDKNCTCSD
jgi:hypothetical protein